MLRQLSAEIVPNNEALCWQQVYSSFGKGTSFCSIYQLGPIQFWRQQRVPSPSQLLLSEPVIEGILMDILV